MDDIYKNIEEYNRNKKRQISIVSDDMIVDMLKDEILNPKVTELFIKDRMVNIFFFFFFFCFYYLVLLFCATKY